MRKYLSNFKVPLVFIGLDALFCSIGNNFFCSLLKISSRVVSISASNEDLLLLVPSMVVLSSPCIAGLCIIQNGQFMARIHLYVVKVVYVPRRLSCCCKFDVFAIVRTAIVNLLLRTSLQSLSSYFLYFIVPWHLQFNIWEFLLPKTAKRRSH